jgi:hypothetical protein
MRSYSKNEIQKILAKAAELEMSKTFDSGADSLTEQEILSLAKDSGISVSSIKAALHSIDAPEFDNSFNWLKGTTRIQHIEHFDTELQSEQIAKVLRILQSNESELGETDLHSKKLTWHLKREIESTKVSLYEDSGKTAFEYSSDWTGLKFVMATFPFLMLFIITLVATKGMGFDKFTSLMIAPVGGFIGLTAGWIYLKSRFENQKKRLHETLDQLRALFIHEDSNNESIVIEEQSLDIEDNRIGKNKVRS